MIKGKKVVLREKRLEDAWNDYTWKKDAELASLDATFPMDVPFSIYLASYSEELRYPDSRSHRPSGAIAARRAVVLPIPDRAIEAFSNRSPPR